MNASSLNLHNASRKSVLPCLNMSPRIAVLRMFRCIPPYTAFTLTRHSMDIFDEYARRQYEAKAPARNPFGIEEEPNKFLEFDVFAKVRVLHQLSVWTLGNADRIRQQMPDQTLEGQLDWVGIDCVHLTCFETG